MILLDHRTYQYAVDETGDESPVLSWIWQDKAARLWYWLTIFDQPDGQWWTLTQRGYPVPIQFDCWGQVDSGAMLYASWSYELGYTTFPSYGEDPLPDLPYPEEFEAIRMQATL